MPLLLAGALLLLMATWKRGRDVLGEILGKRTMPLELLLKDLDRSKITRVPGTAVFMTGRPGGTPVVLMHQLKHLRVLHEEVVLLTVRFADVPYVPPAERVEVERLTHGFYRAVATFGFMGRADVPAAVIAPLRAGGRAGGGARDELLPRPREAGDHEAAGHGAVAQDAVRVHEHQRPRGDGVFQACPPTAWWSSGRRSSSNRARSDGRPPPSPGGRSGANNGAMTLDPAELSPQAFYQHITRAVIPRPIGWVSTVSADGRANLAPYSFFNLVAADPPTVIFSSSATANATASRRTRTATCWRCRSSCATSSASTSPSG